MRATGDVERYASNYEVVKAISESSYKRAMAALAQGYYEEATKHMNTYEHYVRRLNEIRTKLSVSIKERHAGV